MAIDKADNITGETTNLKRIQIPHCPRCAQASKCVYFTQMSQMRDLERRQWLDLGGWVLHCFRLLYNKFSTNLVASHITNLSSHISIGDQVKWVFGSEPYQAEIEVSAMALGSSESQGPLLCTLAVGRVLFLLIVGKKSRFLVGWPPGITLSSSASRHGSLLPQNQQENLCFF